jgi:hypothetical protein
LRARADYLRRVGAAYLLPTRSHLTFWHDRPEVNPALSPDRLSAYYMSLAAKSDYPGPFDREGIPMLDYQGRIGRQYNPIAIAQYGLGNYNRLLAEGDPKRCRNFLRAADWLVANLESNLQGLQVWNHHFDWEYRTPLKAPWYSALAQGQGISLLVRAHQVTGRASYEATAGRAFETFLATTREGGVAEIDEAGDVWFEEAIVEPPTHILNGFIWAAWGVHDFYLHTGESSARRLFDRAVRTIKRNLHRFDCGYWSLYELSGTKLKMLASPFYHRLHQVQLKVMHQLTGELEFAKRAERWADYEKNPLKRTAAIAGKCLFKLLHY